MLNIVKLRIGQEEFAVVVVRVMEALQKLAAEDRRTLADFYYSCVTGSSTWLLSTSVEPLRRLGLISPTGSESHIYLRIGAIVRSAVSVDGEDVELRDPVAPNNRRESAGGRSGGRSPLENRQG